MLTISPLGAPNAHPRYYWWSLSVVEVFIAILSSFFVFCAWLGLHFKVWDPQNHRFSFGRSSFLRVSCFLTWMWFGGCLGGLFCLLKGLSGPFWQLSGSSWGLLGPSWRALGTSFGNSWGHLERPGAQDAPMMAQGAPKSPQNDPQRPPKGPPRGLQEAFSSPKMASKNVSKGLPKKTKKITFESYNFYC